MDAKDFLMVGDSWGLGMKKYFPTNTSIISSGLFTRGGLPSAADQIRNSNYSNGVIIVHSGGNDIGMRGPKKNGKSLVTDEVKQTINAAKAKGCKIIFVAAPWLNHTNPKFTGSNRDRYNSWLREAALANGAGYIDTNPMLSYMQQHQPKRGNFHLNNYSGYANYILKEAQKMTSSTQQNITQQGTQRFNSSVQWRKEKPNKVSRWGVPDKNYSNSNAMALMNFLTNKGLSLEASAGIVGNLMSESGLNPYNYVKNDNGGPSGGIAMWHNKRLQRLKNYATKRGKNWQDIETQANYLWYELTEGGYQHVLNKLKNVKSVEDASFIWGDEFEVFAGHQNRNGKNHRNRRNNALTFANEYKKHNNALPQYAQITPQESLVTQNNQQKTQQDSISNQYDTLSDSQMNYGSSYDYQDSIRDNFNKTFFPIIDTELNNFSDYTIDSKRKGKYSTVDYYSILTNFLKNNTSKFQEGGTIFSTLDTYSKKLQVPTYNTIDYAEIINKVWNNSDGFVKPEDNPVTFGNNIDFTKFNISPTDVELSTNQDTESTTQSPTQDTDKQNLEKIDQTFQQLDFNSKQYSTKDLDDLFGTNLQNALKDGEFDYSKLSLNDSIVLQKLLNTIQNNSKFDSKNISNSFNNDLIDLLVAFDMFDKSDTNGNIPNKDSYSLFQKKGQQSEDVSQHKKGGRMGHPEDTNYEDDIYYDPSIETQLTNTVVNSPITLEQQIIPIQNQYVNPTSNQPPVIAVNDYRGNQPVSAELDVYLKAIKDLQNNNYLSFAQAFRQARNSGLKTFTWRGKLYTTQLAKRSSRRKTYAHKKNK